MTDVAADPRRHFDGYGSAIMPDRMCILCDREVPWTQPDGTKRVLMSDELFAELGASRVDWGEPDEQGFYTPTVYRTDPA